MRKILIRFIRNSLQLQLQHQVSDSEPSADPVCVSILNLKSADPVRPDGLKLSVCVRRVHLSCWQFDRSLTKRQTGDAPSCSAVWLAAVGTRACQRRDGTTELIDESQTDTQTWADVSETLMIFAWSCSFTFESSFHRRSRWNLSDLKVLRNNRNTTGCSSSSGEKRDAKDGRTDFHRVTLNFKLHSFKSHEPWIQTHRKDGFCVKVC